MYFKQTVLKHGVMPASTGRAGMNARLSVGQGILDEKQSDNFSIIPLLQIILKHIVQISS